MYTTHYYPPEDTTLQTNANAVAAAQKIYYIGEFDWTDQNAVQPAGSIAQDNSTASDGVSSAHVSITQNASDSSNNWLIQLTPNLINLNASTPYTVSFYAKAPSNNNVEIVLQQSNFPYTEYTSQKYTLSPIWTKYTMTYTPTSSLLQVYLHFNLAQDGGDIWIDNVDIDGGSGNLITNPSFENTGSSWLSPWGFDIKTVDANVLSEFLPAIESNAKVAGDLYWDLYDNQHSNDSFTLHYPGDTQNMQDQVNKLTTHAQTMTSFDQPVPPTPTATPTVTPTPTLIPTATPTPTLLPTATPTPHPTPTPTPVPLSLSNLSVKDTGNAVDWSIQKANFNTGVKQYGDRTYTITTYSGILRGSWWIRTANDSMKFIKNPTVTFSINKPATVYVAVVNGLAKPSWMGATWVDSKLRFYNSQGYTFILYGKVFPTGTVSLGPDTTNPNNPVDMYTILVR